MGPTLSSEQVLRPSRNIETVRRQLVRHLQSAGIDQVGTCEHRLFFLGVRYGVEMKNEAKHGNVPLVFEDKQLTSMVRFSAVSFCFVLLAALIGFSVHYFNFFTAWIPLLSIGCSVVCLVCNVVLIFTGRAHRATYCALAVGFGILVFLLVYGYSGRSVIWEIHQYRRDKWFFDVGKPKFELIVSRSTNFLGKVNQELKSDMPDVNAFGKRNDDGTVDLEFILIGGVPRQGYLYHTGDPSGKFQRQYHSIKMVTNCWYDVSI